MKRDLLIAFVLTFVFVSCSTTPTGRKQLNLLPDSQMSAMGAAAFQQIKSQTPKVRDESLNNYVQCIVNPLIRVMDKNFQESVKNWEVQVFDQPDTVNAFALPGGKIGVYTGIMKAAQTPDQLAAVLGHEIGHVIAEHGNERVSQNFAAQGGLMALQILTSKTSDSRRGMIMGLMGLGVQVGVLLPFSRLQESEADVIGLDLMAKAGFDPRASVELWKNMQVLGKGGPPEFLSTHPSHETRIEGLKEELGKVMPYYEKAKQQGNTPNCSR